MKPSKNARPNGRWRDRFGPHEVIQRVRPTETDEYLRNPHKGFATFQRFNGDQWYQAWTPDDRNGPEKFQAFRGDPAKLKNSHYPDTTIAYCRWVWEKIEPQKGKYRWELIDGALRSARERGQTLQARLQPHAFGSVYPEWFWAAGAKPMPRKDCDGIITPDYNCLAYVEHWSELIRAFAGRYDGHPNLESFDVSYAGACGETGGNATAQTARELVAVYLDAFRKTQLISQLGTPGCKYAAKVSGRPIGWRVDCFGDCRADGKGVVPDRLCWNHMYDYYPKAIAQCDVGEAWRAAPVNLETCWDIGHWRRKGWDLDWILRQGLAMHASICMAKSIAIPDEWRPRIEKFSRRLGYRFVLRNVTLPLEGRPGQKIELEVWIENVGVAPIYRPYRLAFRFRQGKTGWIVLAGQDIRRWLPGATWFSEKIKLPQGLRKGEAQVDIGIVAGENDPEPKVLFAIKERLKDRWHPLTSLDIL